MVAHLNAESPFRTDLQYIVFNRLKEKGIVKDEDLDKDIVKLIIEECMANLCDVVEITANQIILATKKNADNDFIKIKGVMSPNPNSHFRVEL